MIHDKKPRHFVFIIGTRAQLIKVAPVIIECEKRDLDCVLLMTGQHLETMQDLLDEFGVKSKQISAIPAKERATILSLAAWLPKAYIGIHRQLKSLQAEEKKIDVLVHGDTLSTILGALSGRRLGARVIHLESGLTSNNIFDPFPEEISRRIVFRLSHIAMCPNKETLKHMQRNHPKCDAVNTGGNTIIDAIRLTGVRRNIQESEKPYIVASLHRFQNIYKRNRLIELIELLEKVSETHIVKFVLHPTTRKKLENSGLLERLQKHHNIELLPRLGYSSFLKLAAESACVLTDGGSNQEELAALGVPTIVMRQATERADGLGSNAIMEGALAGNVFIYIKQKAYQALETNRNNTEEKRPSRYILDHLLRSP